MIGTRGPLSALAALAPMPAQGQPMARPVARRPSPQRTVAALPDPSMGGLTSMKDLSGVTTAPDLGAEVAPMTQPGAAPGPLPQQSILSRILEFVRSDEGRAALLRSGAATMRGGLGAGIEAGAGYVDQQKATAARTQQQGLENIFAQERLNQSGQSVDQQGHAIDNSFALGVGNLGETSRAHRVSEGLQGRGQDIQLRGQDIGLQDNREGRDVQRYGIDTGAATSRYGTDAGSFVAMRGQDTGANTSRYVADKNAETQRYEADRRAAGIGSKGTGKGLTAKARAAAQPAPVDPANREVGKIYRSPTGDYGQWTLDGWVPVN